MISKLLAILCLAGISLGVQSPCNDISGVNTPPPPFVECPNGGIMNVTCLTACVAQYQDDLAAAMRERCRRMALAEARFDKNVETCTSIYDTCIGLGLGDPHCTAEMDACLDFATAQYASAVDQAHAIYAAQRNQIVAAYVSCALACCEGPF